MAIITVTNNPDMVTLSNLWNFTAWSVPPVDNLNGTWTVPNEYADSITSALANMDATILAKNAADAEIAIATTGMTPSQLLSVSLGLTQAPVTSTPPTITPPVSPHVAIASVLNGSVPAATGHTFDLGSGVKLWVMAPVPDVLGATANVNITIPTINTPISIAGSVLNQAGNRWWHIGESRNGTTNRINAVIDPTTTTLILEADTSDWQSSGYIAITYV